MKWILVFFAVFIGFDLFLLGVWKLADLLAGAC